MPGRSRRRERPRTAWEAVDAGGEGPAGLFLCRWQRSMGMTKNRRRKAAPVPRGRRTAPRPAPCGPVSPGGASGPSGPALMPMLNCAYQTPLNQRDTPKKGLDPSARPGPGRGGAGQARPRRGAVSGSIPHSGGKVQLFLSRRRGEERRGGGGWVEGMVELDANGVVGGADEETELPPER